MSICSRHFSRAQLLRTPEAAQALAYVLFQGLAGGFLAGAMVKLLAAILQQAQVDSTVAWWCARNPHGLNTTIHAHGGITSGRTVAC